jgi:trans-aconitate 2-methyltransferase
MTDWNSALYMKFENERTRAARDLVAQIPAFNPSSIFDLGCGPGNGTELLAAAFPSATIVGLDLSDNMLAVARTRVAIAQFVKQDIESWRPVEKVDLIFANAALHFVPKHLADDLLLCPSSRRPGRHRRLVRGVRTAAFSRALKSL